MSENKGLSGCRFNAPKTPEPCAENDDQMLPAPRARFRLKRRHVSQPGQHLAAPTPQFLASVAAEDLPIPSIEEPEIATFGSDALHSFDDMNRLQDDQDLSFSRGRAFSPPKTPAPGSVPSLSPSRYPHWSIDWTLSDCESSAEPESRPSTSRSTRTSTSSFSVLSSFSAEIESPEGSVCINKDSEPSYFQPSGTCRKSRKAPWTKAMTTHLWNTYKMYLADPRVTPFRIARNGIPPDGVCRRVACEAKRSWKGSKKALAQVADPSGRHSGSITPTAELPATFMQWPHTGAATLAQLRTLCKQKARGPDGEKFRYFSPSPTPFTNTSNPWDRHVSPGQPTAAFQTQDMAMSLVLSTAGTMQPEGPLAQLVGSAPESAGQDSVDNLDHTPPPTVDAEPTFDERRRLGSPFHAKSYGPSSSSTSLASVLGLASGTSQRQNRTVGPRRALQSPVRISRTSTQKRRPRQYPEGRMRPSLGADLWLDPQSESSMGDGGPGPNSRETRFSSTNTNQHDNLFIPRSQAGSSVTSSASYPHVTRQLAVPVIPPPRLGSPFCASSSVPNRFTDPDDFWMGGRPFSSFHQQSNTSQPTHPARKLELKLAYIDQRLKELNGRDSQRRSESPR